MDFFNHIQGVLHGENVPVQRMVEAVGTPFYLYSRATLEHHWHAFHNAFAPHPHEVCYAVKANSHIAVLNLLARLGSGFDIVSGGELARVMAAGGNPQKTIFSGVGKSPEEINFALASSIGCFNVESFEELKMIHELAKQQNVVAPIALRVNPNVDAKTHPYISTGLKENKFGVDIGEALSLYEAARDWPHLKIKGIGCHIGSQLTSTEPFVEALREIVKIYDLLLEEGFTLEHIDIGGGLGAPYRPGEILPSPKEYAEAIKQCLGHRKVKILLEPGRAIAANAGILVTKVLLLKKGHHKNFAVVDAGMNDLMRPSLYQAWHDIVLVNPSSSSCVPYTYDIVGPVCETSDFFGKDRELPLEPNTVLAIRSAGAYGFTMSSNYNSRPKVAEVMVDGDHFEVIRPRESIQDLFSTETLLREN